jgi:hypothetical protein
MNSTTKEMAVTANTMIEARPAKPVVARSRCASASLPMLARSPAAKEKTVARTAMALEKRGSRRTSFR